jgi:hypothetical protein
VSSINGTDVISKSQYLVFAVLRGIDDNLRKILVFKQLYRPLADHVIIPLAHTMFKTAQWSVQKHPRITLIVGTVFLYYFMTSRGKTKNKGPQGE